MALLGSEVRVRQTEHQFVPHRGVLLVIPAQDEAVLSLHLLHPVFSDLMEQIT